MLKKKKEKKSYRMVSLSQNFKQKKTRKNKHSEKLALWKFTHHTVLI